MYGCFLAPGPRQKVSLRKNEQAMKEAFFGLINTNFCKISFISDIKPEGDDISVLYLVGFAFKPQGGVFFGRGHGACGNVVPV